MSIKVGCISHDMRILGGIVGVRGGTIVHAANENAWIPGRGADPKYSTFILFLTFLKDRLYIYVKANKIL